MSTQQSGSPDNPGLIMRPPIFVLVAILVAAALEWLIPFRFLPEPGLGSPLSWMGLMVVVGGWVLAIRGIREFRAAGTNVHPTEPSLRLVTTGPYRFSRNPMYIGLNIVFLGLGLMFALEWGLILVPLLWLVFDRYIVAQEEAYLTRKFGDQYRSFLSRTRRWL